MVNQAKKDFEGRIQIVELNLDDQNNVNLATEYQVNVIPTYVFLDSKGTIVDRAVGALKKDDLYSRLRAIEGR